MFNLPTTPEACSAECERVLGLLADVVAADESVEAQRRKMRSEWGIGADAPTPEFSKWTSSQKEEWQKVIQQRDPAYRAWDTSLNRRLVLALLEAHAQALEAAQWVSVEERLPEGSGFVNAVASGVVSPLWYGDGVWRTPFGNAAKHPTHWQKLPTPPAAAATAQAGE